MRNPSEIFRDWEEELETIRVMFRDCELSKKGKAALLRRLRTLETLLDRKGFTYNSTAFREWVQAK